MSATHLSGWRILRKDERKNPLFHLKWTSDPDEIDIAGLDPSYQIANRVPGIEKLTDDSSLFVDLIPSLFQTSEWKGLFFEPAFLIANPLAWQEVQSAIKGTSRYLIKYCPVGTSKKAVCPKAVVVHDIHKECLQRVKQPQPKHTNVLLTKFLEGATIEEEQQRYRVDLRIPFLVSLAGTPSLHIFPGFLTQAPSPVPPLSPVPPHTSVFSTSPLSPFSKPSLDVSHSPLPLPPIASVQGLLQKLIETSVPSSETRGFSLCESSWLPVEGRGWMLSGIREKRVFREDPHSPKVTDVMKHVLDVFTPSHTDQHLQVTQTV